MTISYFGIPGSFSHQAAIKYFPDGTVLQPAPSVNGVFESVADGQADAGIVPLENSLHGNVVESFDLLASHDLSIIGEVYLKIHHCLLANKNRKDKHPDLRWAKRCLSHWQAISQCEPFFTSHPWITPVFCTDTASAAQEIARHPTGEDIAIGGTMLASLYGLDIVKEHVEKDRNNFTRFGIIAKTPNTEGEKITITFSVKHVPGSLVLALTPYATHGLNLMQIESRPKQGSPWEYNFFVDLEIGKKKGAAAQALAEMREQTSALTIVGRYAKGEMYET